MSAEGIVRELGWNFNQIHPLNKASNPLTETRTWAQALPESTPMSKILGKGLPISISEALIDASRIADSTQPLHAVATDDFAHALGFFTPITSEGSSGIYLNLDGVMALTSRLLDTFSESELSSRKSASRGAGDKREDGDKSQTSLGPLYEKVFTIAANCSRELIMLDAHVEHTWMWLAQLMQVPPLREIYSNPENILRIRDAGGLRLMRSSSSATKRLSFGERQAIFDALALTDFGRNETFSAAPNARIVCELELEVVASMLQVRPVGSGHLMIDMFIPSPHETYFRKSVNWFSYNRGLTHEEPR